MNRCSAFYQYQQRPVKNNAMDFDDMLVYTNRIPEDYPVVRETYGHKFEHILVENFRTEPGAICYLRLLAKNRNPMWLAMMTRVSRWRGADRNILRFNRISSAKTILLEQNYRSKNVLDGARSSITIATAQ